MHNRDAVCEKDNTANHLEK